MKHCLRVALLLAGCMNAGCTKASATVLGLPDEVTIAAPGVQLRAAYARPIGIVAAARRDERGRAGSNAAFGAGLDYGVAVKPGVEPTKPDLISGETDWPTDGHSGTRAFMFRPHAPTC